MVIWGQVHQIFTVLTEFLQKTYITHCFLFFGSFQYCWSLTASGHHPLSLHGKEQHKYSPFMFYGRRKNVIHFWKYTWVRKWWKIMKIKLYFLLLLPACGKLTGISDAITIKTSGSRYGSWMTDPLAPDGDTRVSSSILYCLNRIPLDFFFFFCKTKIAVISSHPSF